MLPEKKQILVVDDEPNLRRVLSAQLVRDGYDVHTAEDGEQGLAILGEHHVDLVITDLRMPKVDGMELLRKARSFIKVNCAAIPHDLIESELFGYEKGAFTGAAGSKPGRFELATGGTLFLDEIGTIPIEMQVKLLRALQESEFERVGGIKTMRVDVRLGAATNPDLKKPIAAGTFPKDLFYRPNALPLR